MLLSARFAWFTATSYVYITRLHLFLFRLRLGGFSYSGLEEAGHA